MNELTKSSFLDMDDIRKLTSLSKGTIYNLMHSGKFPKAKRLGPRRVAWLQSDIDEWVDSLEENCGETPL